MKVGVLAGNTELAFVQPPAYKKVEIVISFSNASLVTNIHDFSYNISGAIIEKVSINGQSYYSIVGPFFIYL
ncbi:hypothetical protein AB835_10665 [Candidatus Endobugula sertula]|uniref:Uncharacterized protein n=1 Tax=Candidatus Endobugula sertula TaxID=62101 RepID=A0A1D2QNG0_9GAMM|nr:hypothetical protein AB835_10665 [Candidatus Endobugula sertula]